MQEQLPRRKKGRIASYVILFTTQKMDKKASKLGIFFAGNRLKSPLPIPVSPGSKMFKLFHANSLVYFFANAAIKAGNSLSGK